MPDQIGRGFPTADPLQGISVDSATTTDIWGGGDSLHITGTTTITSFGTAPYAGSRKLCIADGSFILTNGTDLKLPGSANITTGIGDSWEVYADTTTQFDIIKYTRSDGSPILVSEASLQSGIVSQAKLKTASGEVTTSSPGAAINLTLPGGVYGFYPQIRNVSVSETLSASIYNNVTTSTPTTYATYIYLAPGVGSNARAQQQYIQACPPYDLGDGEVPLFIFALVDVVGKIFATYVAPEAPWHYNGPTNIRAEYYTTGRKGFRMEKQFLVEHKSIKAALAKGMNYDQIADQIANSPMVEMEITQEIKNADMALIPHPFIGNNLNGKTVVLLDPVSSLVGRLSALHECGESISELLQDRNLLMDNTALVRMTPPGVITCAGRFKLTS